MQVLIIALAIIAVPAILILYWIFRPRWVQKRRARIRAQALPERFVDVLRKNVHQYTVLPQEFRAELHGHINVFLSEKQFFGCGGLEITDEIRYTIAGYACLLLLNREPSYFPGFTSILVYPDTYESAEVVYDGDVEVHERSVRAGESWERGPVILSWADVLRGSADYDDGFNVVLHEFAHKMDEENSGTDGLPILRDDAHYEDWARVFSSEYQTLEVRVDVDENDVIDEYGLTSPAEFFAVATESFFEKPGKMKRELPDLYAQLRNFYGIDPATWK